jgi:PAS domain S-box-containing protein
MKRLPVRPDVYVALLYALFGGLWIFLSDTLLIRTIKDIPTITTISIYADWIFVIISAILIYFLLRRELQNRKIVKGEIAKSEETYRYLFANNPHPMWVYDLHTLAFLEAAVARYGFSRAEFLQMTIKDIRPPEELPLLMENLAQRRMELEYSEGWHHRLKDGTLIDISITSHALQFNGHDAALVIAQDITERKRAEGMLRESEARFRQLSDSTFEGIAIHDKGILLDANESFCSMFGYERSEIIGKPVLELTAPESRDLILEHVRTGYDKPYEGLGLRKDGTKFEAELMGKPIQYNGRLVRVAALRDITERRQTEVLLSESEERYRQLLDVAPIAIAVHSDGKLVFTNPAGAKLLGAYSPKELIGKSISEIVHPDRWDAARNRIQRMLNGEQGLYPTEEEYIKLDGSTIQVEVIAAPLTYNNKPAVQVIVSDITERKQAQDEIRHLKEFDENLINNMSEGIVVQNIDGYFTYANPAVFSITGYLPDELIGQHWTKFFPIEQHEIIKEADKQRLIGEASRYETDFLHKSGRRINMFVSGSPLFENKLFNGSMAVFTDITERKRAEQQIAQQLQHLKALHTIDTAIASNFDLRVTIETLLEQLNSQLRVDVASICLFDKNMLTLEHMTSVGFYSAPVHGAKSKVAESLAGRAITERRAIHIPNLSEADIDPINAYRYRSEKFISYYAVPLIAKGQVQGVMEVFQRTPLEIGPDWLNFLDNMAGQAAIAIDNSRLFNDLQKSNMELVLAYNATIEGWSRALDLRDRETEGHTRRVTDLAERLAQAMNISEIEIIHIRRGALLHDIGKLGVPDSVLLKPDKLTADELQVMHRHPTLAYEMLQPIDYLKPSLQIPYCHHEKWDGTGYPRGLKGEQIPLDARIFAVVDVWDALLSDRPYRSAWPKEQALDYIKEQSGKHFDPQIVEIFLRMLTNS